MKVKIISNSTHLHTDDLESMLTDSCECLALPEALVQEWVIEIEVHYTTGQYLKAGQLCEGKHDWEPTRVLHVLPPERWKDSPMNMMVSSMENFVFPEMARAIQNSFIHMIARESGTGQWGAQPSAAQIRMNPKAGMTKKEVQQMRKVWRARRTEFYISKRLTRTLKGLRWMVPYAARCVARLEKASEVLQTTGAQPIVVDTALANEDLETLITVLKQTTLVRRLNVT